MSTLIENLNSIYTTKSQIKEALGTESDVFANYPSLITTAINNASGLDWNDVATAGYIVPSGTITIDDNEIGNNVDVSSYQYAYIDIQGGGGGETVKGDPTDMFVSIRPGYSGLSNYPYFYDQWIDTGNSDNSVDGSVTVHTLISDGFPSWGIDTNDFVSSIKRFEVYDWNNGDPTFLQDLSCTTMVQEYSSNYDCWCLVEGTLQNATNVCFKSDNGSWDDMSNMWMMDNNWTLMEYMPVVDTGGYVLYDGTYISLPAGEVYMYLHYQGSDGDACNVYIRVYDESNQMWTDKWKMIEYTDQTFVNPNASEPDPGY